MSPSRIQPVRRLRVLLGALCILAVLAGIVLMTESLRHTLPIDEALSPEFDDRGSDPRDEVVCPDPLPREGQEREEDTAGDALEPLTEVSSSQLYDCPGSFDGRSVQYTGEVVGAVLRRREGAWVQLNDDIYADAAGPLPRHRYFRGGNSGVGVFIPLDLADEIGAVGGPRFRGDRMTIRGMFHRVDARSAEVTVIRALTGEVVSRGEPISHEPLPDRRNTALALLALMAGVVVAERIVARRR